MIEAHGKVRTNVSDCHGGQVVIRGIVVCLIFAKPVKGRNISEIATLALVVCK